MTGSWWGAVLFAAAACSGPSPGIAASAGNDPPRVLPAYAHNDYRNVRPLFDALAAGCQGVEVDLFLVGGRLLVAHDRDEVDPSRTLEHLYLTPLRDLLRRHGEILPQGRTFHLNVELKSTDPAAYDSLRRGLLRYREMLTLVRGETEEPGPIDVILVGWHPSLEELSRESERIVAVQWLQTPSGPLPPPAPAHLIRLVSLNYGRSRLWARGAGGGPMLRRALRRLRQARDAVPGRIARVYNVPVREPAYRALLAAGVDLIGTKEPGATRALLAGSR